MKTNTLLFTMTPLPYATMTEKIDTYKTDKTKTDDV